MDFFAGLLEHLFRRSYAHRIPESEMIVETQEELDEYNISMSEGGAGWLYLVCYVYGMSQVIQKCTQVLDIGCGSGHLLILLAKANPHIAFVGTDESDAALEEGLKNVEKNGLTNVHFVKSNLVTLHGIENTSYDGVVSRFAYHHLRDETQLEAAFNSVRRILKSDGAICIIDFHRLKSNRLMHAIAYRNEKKAGKHVSRLFFESFCAAFTKADFRPSFSYRTDVQIYKNFFAPFQIVIRTKKYTLRPEVQHFFEILHNALPWYKSVKLRILVLLFA